MLLRNVQLLSRCVIAGFAVGMAGLASGQCQVVPVSDLTLPGGLQSDGRTSIARQGDLMVVGIRLTNTQAGLNLGSAYIYERLNNQWMPVETLIPNDLSDQDGFGGTVALDGDTIAVAATGHDAAGLNAGAVYIYHYDGTNWTLQQKLLPAFANGQDGFGMAIGISGDRMLIGSTGNSIGGNFAGAVYAYSFDGSSWVMDQLLRPTDNDAVDFFGQSIDIDNTRAAIGALRDEFAGPGTPDTGSVAIYDLGVNGWTQTATLHPTTSGAKSFGYSVSLNGTNLLVGSPNTSSHFRDAGSAYIYAYDGETWDAGTELTPTTITAADRYGAYVELDGNVAVIHAPEDRQYPTPNAGPGRIYIYTNDGAAWSFEQSYFGGLSGNITYRNFGVSPTLEGNDLVLYTANQDLGSATGSASIISFDLGCEANICLPDVNGDNALDATDFTAWIAAYNSGDPSADQNQDGMITPADFTAWVANFNTGCSSIM